jgi:DNA-binding GntR family transcriptional regulator
LNPLDAVPAGAEEEAFGFVLNRIRTGIYGPGDRLVPEEIAAEISMSRMPVRDAIRRLAAQQLVTLRPNRAAVVRTLDLAELTEVFEMRAVLEGLAAVAAMESIGIDELAELERRLETMERCEANPSDWIAAHGAFHLYLCGLSGKPRLLAQISALHVTVEPHMRMWLQSAEKPLSSNDDHALILNALRRRRPALVEAVMRDHINSTIPALARLAGLRASAPLDA